jgi:alanine dehydrogenase
VRRALRSCLSLLRNSSRSEPMVQVESRAGLNAARTDDEYREAGAEIILTEKHCSPTPMYSPW